MESLATCVQTLGTGQVKLCKVKLVWLSEDRWPGGDSQPELKRAAWSCLRQLRYCWILWMVTLQCSLHKRKKTLLPFEDCGMQTDQTRVCFPADRPFVSACLFLRRPEHTFPTQDKTWILGGLSFPGSRSQSPVLRSAFYPVKFSKPWC